MPGLPASGTLLHPNLGQIVPYTITELSDDPDTQVRQTIDLMRRYVLEDLRSPLLAQDVAAAWQSDDPLADTWAYLSRYGGTRGIAFIRDEVLGQPFEDSPGGSLWRPLVETLIRPVALVTYMVPQGDCDDFAMLGAAHLMARGVPCSFATVAVNPAEPDLYSHVYLVAYPGGQRVVMDLSHGQYPGWEVPNMFGKRKEWPITEGAGGFGTAVLVGGLIGISGYLIYRCAAGSVN